MDYSLYLVMDAALLRGRSHRQIVEAAIRGGVTVVQYRDKSASTRRMIEEAAEIHSICRRSGVSFIVNDRVDIALAVDADGVHVGQDDMPASIARKLIGPGKILGLSAGSVEEAVRAFADGADYVGTSPVFSTPTKPDASSPVGQDGLRAISAAIPIPVVAIGGMNADNAADMIRCGAAGVAVVSAIVSAQDVELASRLLRAALSGARRPRLS